MASIGPSWILDRKNFSYFWCTRHPDASYLKSIGLSVQKKKQNIDFQDGFHGAILDFGSDEF